jgi:VanZ family protein
LHNRSGLIKVLSVLIILILVSIIFYSSLNSGHDSNEASKKVALFIADAVSGILNLPTVEPNSELFNVIHAVVRKLAHFTEYFILSILIYFACRKFDMSWKKAKLFSFLSAFVLACTDETVQLFVPGRDGRVTDVLIDSSGALIAVAIIKLFEKMVIQKRKRVENSNYQ